MSDVKRWSNWCAATHGHGMIESEFGWFVLASDYDALAARLAEAERDAKRYRHIRENDSARVALQGWTENGPEALDDAIDEAIATPETVGDRNEQR